MLEQYSKSRGEEAIENFQNYFDQLTDWGKKSLIEKLKTEYIKNNL